MTDSIADLLTRIRNALQVRHEAVAIPYSKLKEAILGVLVEEGYLKGSEAVGEGVRKQLVAQLKYRAAEAPVISGLKRISRPGRRVYRGADGLLDMAGGGLGATLVSTSQGIMTHRKAREARLGGEVLCHVW